jgi:triosephosphate isomerase
MKHFATLSYRWNYQDTGLAVDTIIIIIIIIGHSSNRGLSRLVSSDKTFNRLYETLAENRMVPVFCALS